MKLLGKDNPLRSALKITGTYAVLGTLWILFSDRLIYAVADSGWQLTHLQSMKGIGFIILSSLIIFLLVSRALRHLQNKKTELEAVLEQAGRLHRILRHNLRNSCQIIDGNAELLAEQAQDEENEYLKRIREQNNRLITLSRKSIYLRDFLDIENNHRITDDLVATVRTQVEHARENYPTATIMIDCPAHAHVYAHPHIGEAVEELIENAIQHNDSDDPRVWVSIRKEKEMVTVTVADNGPGIPPVERVVLERKTETPTEHSQGLGLWLVYLTVHYSDGTLTVADRDEGGAEIQATIPSS